MRLLCLGGSAWAAGALAGKQFVSRPPSGENAQLRQLPEWEEGIFLPHRPCKALGKKKHWVRMSQNFLGDLMNRKDIVSRMQKRLALCLLVVFTMTVAASTQTLTPAERDKAIVELEGSRQAFLDATKGLSPAQWNFKAGPDRWSIAECAEHIALSEDFIFGVVTNQVMKSPLTPEKRDAVKGKDDVLVKMLQDRSHKATAPEPIDPTKRPMPAANSVKQFLASRAHTIEYVKTTQDDLRDHFADHPVPAIGTLDAYQWVLLISGHSRRHTLQILEVKADPNFPKN
jgi:hypothetical protein